MHTPGPWTIVESSDGRPYIRANGRTIAKTYRSAIVAARSRPDYGSGIEVLPGVENARMIAAAPDMYEALKRCLLYIENDEEDRGRKSDEGNEARAALAKAAGEQADETQD